MVLRRARQVDSVVVNLNAAFDLCGFLTCYNECLQRFRREDGHPGCDV